MSVFRYVSHSLREISFPVNLRDTKEKSDIPVHRALNVWLNMKCSKENENQMDNISIKQFNIQGKRKYSFFSNSKLRIFRPIFMKRSL